MIVVGVANLFVCHNYIMGIWEIIGLGMKICPSITSNICGIFVTIRDICPYFMFVDIVVNYMVVVIYCELVKDLTENW